MVAAVRIEDAKIWRQIDEDRRRAQLTNSVGAFQQEIAVREAIFSGNVRHSCLEWRDEHLLAAHRGILGAVCDAEPND